MNKINICFVSLFCCLFCTDLHKHNIRRHRKAERHSHLCTCICTQKCYVCLIVNSCFTVKQVDQRLVSITVRVQNDCICYQVSHVGILLFQTFLGRVTCIFHRGFGCHFSRETFCFRHLLVFCSVFTKQYKNLKK